MSLERKKIECKCGETTYLDKKKSWCDKCGRPVFYDPKDAKHHKINTIYMISMLIAAFMFVTYIFFEMVAKPISMFK